MPKVKICGNTNLEDAKLAAELGADYLGLIFTQSKRLIDPDQAATIVNGLPDFENFVGVFCNQSKEEVESIANKAGIKMLQFHGDETSRYCDYFREKGYRIIKTFRIKDSLSLKRIDEYDVDAFLFDTFSKTERGGTGTAFDWNLIEDKPYVGEKLFLAGGLNLDNVEEAIRRIKPFAVDVASGVEAEPGKKDPEKLEKFIQICKKSTLNNA